MRLEFLLYLLWFKHRSAVDEALHGGQWIQTAYVRYLVGAFQPNSVCVNDMLGFDSAMHAFFVHD